MNKEKERTLIGHSTEPDPDGQKHEWLQYKYKDYIINKEWYMNMENEYALGITIFKKGNKKVNRLTPPSIEYENEYYNEIFHSGNSKETTDDELIELVETIIGKY